MKNSRNGKKKKQKQKQIKINFNKRNILFLIIFSLIMSVLIQKSFTSEHLVSGFFISLICISILYRDIFRYKPFYTKQKKMLVLLGFMMVGTMSLGRLFEYVFVNFSKGLGFIPPETVIYGIPIPAGAMLTSLLFDPHTAIIFSFIMSIISGVWLHDSYFIFYVFVGSIIAAFSVIRCKKRSDIVKGGIYVSGISALSVIAISMFNDKLTAPELLPSLIFALSSGITLAAFVSIMLPVLEYIFKVSTDITLLELLDLNQPLMKNLMINAPGTYHHSVIVGNLVETAAEEIGVNPLLARVSAYYHDIGKIRMPEYFIENKSSSISKHDKLTPHMSSMIIISHVKEGLELADEYNLPEVVKEIIKEHHGNSVITYFFNKAKEEVSIDLPSEEDYRYPGPRPQSRVSALVMMADAVEASSRVLTEPTPSRVNNLVDKIVNSIFIDGQLDECELTLKDIYLIKKRFCYILNGILHKRIEYPGFDLNENNNEKKKSEEDFRFSGIHKEFAAKSKDRLRPVAQNSGTGNVIPELKAS